MHNHILNDYMLVMLSICYTAGQPDQHCPAPQDHNPVLLEYPQVLGAVLIC
jgi:hypothetical protein